VENLLEYDRLKSMCERLRISAVSARDPHRIRFHPKPPWTSAKRSPWYALVAGIKLDPSGVLWMEVKRGESIPLF